MSTITVRLFVSHPVAAAQYFRVLSAEKDFRLLTDTEPSQLGVFDLEPVPLRTVFTVERRKYPAMRPLLMSASCEEQECVRRLREGFWGVVAYERYEEELARAVRQVAEGYLRFPGLFLTKWSRTHGAHFAPAPEMHLTPRECEVLDLLVADLSNKEIAGIHRVREKTVKFHVGNIFLKLGIHSRRELRGISSLPPFRIRFSSPRPPG